MNFKNETALLLDEFAFPIVENPKVITPQIPGFARPSRLSGESPGMGL